MLYLHTVLAKTTLAKVWTMQCPMCNEDVVTISNNWTIRRDERLRNDPLQFYNVMKFTHHNQRAVTIR